MQNPSNATPIPIRPAYLLLSILTSLDAQALRSEVIHLLELEPSLAPLLENAIKTFVGMQAMKSAPTMKNPQGGEGYNAADHLQAIKEVVKDKSLEEMLKAAKLN